MRPIVRFAALTLWIPASLAAVQAQAPSVSTALAGRPEVLVLGSYHMANPGQDIFNLQADDVLVPKRQAEMAAVIAVLKKFQPTKIAVERYPGDRRTAQDYAEYLAGKRALTRNEIEQIGFRLAKELAQDTVHGVDADGEFPYPRLVKYARATNRSKELDALMAEWGERSKATDEYLRSHSILDTLLYLNSEAQVAEEVGFYYRQAHFGERWDWAGADLLSDWFRRNMRIFSNAIQLLESPRERLLIVFGSGHLGWLRQEFASDPTVHLRTLAEFTR
jgi:hypothetical protein